jgi:hypothetical protein
MKKLIHIVLFFSVIVSSYSQINIGEPIEQSAKSLSLKGLGEEAIKDFLNKNLQDPQLYNDAWQKLIKYALQKDAQKWNFLKDLNIVFKTFQSTTSNASSLGFHYDFSFSYANFSKTVKNRTSKSLNFKLKGNVAFNRDINPNDFLDTSLDYTFTKYFGGVVKKETDTVVLNRLDEINNNPVLLNSPNSAAAKKLLDEYYSLLQYSNQYYIGFAPQLSLESNQNFTNKQFVYSGNLALGAKAWDKNSTLTWLNILDYPFALLRWIIMPDTDFQPYGSTIPTVLVGINYVNPINDFNRQAITGNTDGYERFNFESSFRTFVARIEKENIFFSANVRYYKEIDASDAIKAANLDEFFYFVGALQSTSGFYVSYAKGKLPFDAINDEVYAVGFNYKF